MGACRSIGVALGATVLATVTPAGPVRAVDLPPPLDPRCRVGRVVCVEETTEQLWLVTDGVVQMSLIVRLGAPSHPTRLGVFPVYWKDRKHVSSLYPGLQMPYSLFFSRGEAVHYSPEFADNGYDMPSHGCVETRDEKQSADLFDLVRVGDKVVVYRSSAGHPHDDAGQVTLVSPLSDAPSDGPVHSTAKRRGRTRGRP